MVRKVLIKDDVVETWRRYTRIRERGGKEDNNVRRIENSSWRLWFKERNKKE
jgi:hypothetical protein